MAPSTITHLNIQRKPHELLTPAKPTPYEYKLLSDIDDLETMRFHGSTILFYRNDPSLAGRDPVNVIREAVKETLVFFYPFAGRIRKVLPGHKLLVECTGEGVLFIEANANVTLEEFGEVLPPFPKEGLLYNVQGSDGIINSPLTLIQVTRLMCGGFVFAIRFNHTMSDGDGILQFMTAISEMARGARSPLVLPVWRREILLSKNQRRLEYNNQGRDDKGTITRDMTCHSFYFGQVEISALRKLVPQHLSRCSTIDVLTACLWRCRTIALQPEPEEETDAIIYINTRKILTNPPLPMGYYGNALVTVEATSSARKLWESTLDYALELVMEAKAKINEELVSLWFEKIFSGNSPPFQAMTTFQASDLTRLRFEDVDFGWGKAAYGGPAESNRGFAQSTCFYVSYTNKKGESGIVVPFCLPAPAMERFSTELENMLKYNKISIISGL